MVWRILFALLRARASLISVHGSSDTSVRATIVVGAVTLSPFTLCLNNTAALTSNRTNISLLIGCGLSHCLFVMDVLNPSFFEDAFSLLDCHNEIIFFPNAKGQTRMLVSTHPPSAGSSAWWVPVEPPVEGLTPNLTEAPKSTTVLSHFTGVTKG